MINSELASHTMMNTNESATEEQYTLTKIIAIWLAASIPMGILGWIVAPALSPDLSVDPIG